MLVLFTAYLWDTRNIAMASFGSILVDVGQTYLTHLLLSLIID